MSIKMYVSKVFKYHVVTPKGEKFCQEKVRSSNIFDEEDKKTLVYGLNDRSIRWSSSLDYSDISNEAWNKIFKNVVIPDTEDNKA